MPKVDAELFFNIDEKNNQVELTEKGIELMKAEGYEPAAWVTEMLAEGVTSFYAVKEGSTYFYSLTNKK